MRDGTKEFGTAKRLYNIVMIFFTQIQSADGRHNAEYKGIISYRFYKHSFASQSAVKTYAKTCFSAVNYPDRACRRAHRNR